MKTAAFIVGGTGPTAYESGPAAALAEMARRIGFGPVTAYESISQIEMQARHTPVCFVLCAASEGIESLRPVAEAIRFAPSRRVRFSPLVYFAETPSLETIKACVNLGFDDVVALPFSADRIGQRLARLVGKTQVYYETPTYFGPDRRGREAFAPTEQRWRLGAPVRRIEIMRSLGVGTSVLRDDLEA
jgi:CheY-like chemotaxis protein